MRAIVCALVALVLTAGDARAEEWAARDFKLYSRGREVRDVSAIRLSGGRDFDHVLIGEVKNGELWQFRAYLVRCERDGCYGDAIYLYRADEIRLALIDLAGKGGEIKPLLHQRPGRLGRLETRGLRRPALVIETVHRETKTSMNRAMKRVTGTATEAELRIFSLRRRDHKRPRVFRVRSRSVGATGAGFWSTFSLVRIRRSRMLGIEEKRQKLVDRALACMRPKPVTIRYVWVEKERRYVDASKLAMRGGCG